MVSEWLDSENRGQRAKLTINQEDKLSASIMKLYVGNLPFSATREDIEEIFEPYGPIEDVHVVMDRETQRPRGFAFVTLAEKSQGIKAVEALNENDMGGRKLVVNEARPREERSPGGGGGGGGGRRSFGGGGGGRGNSGFRGR